MAVFLKRRKERFCDWNQNIKFKSVNSSKKCNFLLWHLVRCFIVEFSNWMIVDQPLHPSYRIRRDLGDVGPFRDETSDVSDPVFHRSLDLACVRACEIGLNAEYPRYLLMTAESLVVVEGDGMDRIGLIVQRFCQSLFYPFAILSMEFANLGVMRRHVGDDHYGTISFPAHHQICLKIIRTNPISHDIWPIRDRDTTRNRPSGIFEPATLTALATMFQEAMKTMVRTVYGLMASLASPYPLIQTFMAYRTQTRLTTDGDDVLWAPFVIDLPMVSLFLYSLCEPYQLGLLLMASLCPSLSLDGRMGTGTPPPRRGVAPQFPAYRGGVDPDGLCNRFLAHSCVP